MLGGLKLMWDRITFSRLTTTYFIFSFVHFILQVALQIQAFSINAQAANSLYNVLVQGNAAVNGFAVYDGDLRFCNRIPSTLDASSCQVVWDGTPRANNWAASADNSSTLTSPSVSPVVAAISTVPTPTSSTQSSSSLSSSTRSSSSLSSSLPPLILPSSILPSSSLPSSSLSLSRVPSNTSTLSSVPPKTTVTVIKVVDVGAPSASSSVAAIATVTPAPTPTTVEALDEADDDFVGELTNQRRDLFGQIQAVKNENGTFSVNITGFGYDHTAAVLNSECLAVLNWPVEILLNTKREDVTFIAFQFWVLGMSIVALLNESIPHIIASLLTHMLATAWAGFQISHTENFRQQFVKLTTQGACKPVNLLPHYWTDRGHAEIPSLALNILALLISCFLTWRLVKSFGWQTFKRVGASLTINRVYKIVLTMSITIQISLFFMVCALGLWIDQLFNGSIGQLATRAGLYRGLITVTLILLVPWLAAGWFAVRREHRLLMAIFLVFSIMYMAGWGFMFVSTTFRWTFIQWRFFALMSSASVMLTLASFVLGVMCRLNFGKGLTRYLSAQQPLAGEEVRDSDEDRDIEEKIDFPSRDKSMPTFAVTFGSGSDVPPPSQIPFGPRLGPRFFNKSAEPFEPQFLTTPPPAHTRLGSEESFEAGQISAPPLYRSDSGRSTDSGFSQTERLGNGRGHGANKKRWVIE